MGETTAIHFYNWTRARNLREQKCWTSIHRSGESGEHIHHEHHLTEAEARAACGLRGGNRDPLHRPPVAA